MKKAILFLSFLFTLGITTANAQSCASAGKSCCASKMAKAAASDATIEKRQTDEGAVTYVRKETDTDGNVKFVSVQFDENTNTFVNVAPKSATASADSKATMTKKSCSASEKKACCAGKAGAKSCAGGNPEQE